MNPLAIIPLLFAACQPVTISTPVFMAPVTWTYSDNGILSHNTDFPGNEFDRLYMGDEIVIECEGGRTLAFVVTGHQRVQAYDAHHFEDLDTGQSWTDSELFHKHYYHQPALTLQTCIENGADDAWGRLFVTAERLNPVVERKLSNPYL